MSDKPGVPTQDNSDAGAAGAAEDVVDDFGGIDANSEEFLLDMFNQTEGFDAESGEDDVSSGGVAQRAEVAQPTEVGTPAAPAATSEQVAPVPPAQTQQQVPAAEAPVQAAPETQQVPPAQPGQQQQPQVQQPVGAPQDQGTQPQAAAPVQQQQDSVAALQAEIEKNKDTYIGMLAEQVYKLDDETVEALNTEPASVIPKLLARAHVEMARNVLATVAQHVPAAVMGTLEAQRRSEETMQAFYAKWPQLDRAKDQATVLQIARQFRHLNPNADFETMANFVGSQAVVMLGRTGQPVTAPAPTNPTMPARPAPFVPAGRGAPVRGPAPKSDNPFADIADMLAMDFDQVD